MAQCALYTNTFWQDPAAKWGQPEQQQKQPLSPVLPLQSVCEFDHVPLPRTGNKSQEHAIVQLMSARLNQAGLP
jgi:hypothetical protein